ncbi:MAG: hypothetical protein J0H40_09610 [Rhizobiales bacterium]|nr:hypothetical protein [Hyphomicrobiales bacterium]
MIAIARLTLATIAADSGVRLGITFVSCLSDISLLPRQSEQALSHNTYRDSLEQPQEEQARNHGFDTCVKTQGITPLPRPDITLSATHLCPIAPPPSALHREGGTIA